MTSIRSSNASSRLKTSGEYNFTDPPASDFTDRPGEYNFTDPPASDFTDWPASDFADLPASDFADLPASDFAGCPTFGVRKFADRLNNDSGGSTRCFQYQQNSAPAKYAGDAQGGDTLATRS
jgi:hypothetical protein